MAVGTPVSVATGSDNVDDTTLSSSSFTPTVGNVLVAFVTSDNSSPDTGTDLTISHAGVSSWDLVRDPTDTGNELLAAFIGEVTSATADTVDITWTNACIRKMIRVLEISDCSATVVDSGEDSSPTGTPTVTPALDGGASDSANLLVAAAYDSGTGITISSDDFTDFGDITVGGSAALEVSYKNGVSDSDCAYSMDSGSGGHNMGVIMELQEPAGAGPTGPVAQVITTGV